MELTDNQPIYSDGRELHFAPEGQDRTICGEFTVGELLPADMDQPMCKQCEAGELYSSPRDLASR